MAHRDAAADLTGASYSPPRTSKHLHCAHQCFQHTEKPILIVSRLRMPFSDQEHGHSASVRRWNGIGAQAALRVSKPVY